MKLLPVVAAITLTLAGLSSAHAQGFFIDGRAGKSDMKDVPGADDDTGFVFGAGYWFNRHFAVEGGYAKLYDRDSIETDGFYAGVKGRALFDRGNGTGFFVGGRGGLYHWDGKAGDVFDDNGTDWYAGAFAGYQFSPAWNVSINYDRFRADDLNTDLLSAGLEYTF